MRFGKLVLYGILTWLIPFMVSVLLFSIHETQRPLFESIMAVVVTAAAVTFAGLYLRKVEGGYLGEGILIGLVWMAINILIDLPLFSAGPMTMPLGEYVKDIGLTYLIIPVVCIGSGWLLAQKRR